MPDRHLSTKPFKSSQLDDLDDLDDEFLVPLVVTYRSRPGGSPSAHDGAALRPLPDFSPLTLFAHCKHGRPGSVLCVVRMSRLFKSLFFSNQ